MLTWNRHLAIECAINGALICLVVRIPPLIEEARVEVFKFASVAEQKDHILPMHPLCLIVLLLIPLLQHLQKTETFKNLFKFFRIALNTIH